MDFSSITGFLDRSKWQQQLNYQTGSGGSNPPPPAPQPLQTSAPPPPPPHMGGGGGGGTGSIRPGSMADRARMANIPMPEAPLKCPRCESTNTKFCYFNNYSLLQPRHFCKTCRRYWTLGGALRSVPVGGGCRRNKRTKGDSNPNKSPASSGDQQSTPSGSANTIPSSSGTSNILGLASQFPQLRLMAPFGHLSDHQFGLNYGGISTPVTSEMNYQMGSTNSLFGESVGGVGMDQQWRPQQFPFMGGLDPPPSGLYPFQGGDPSGYAGPEVCTSVISQMTGSVKMEDNNQEKNLSRRLLGVDHWSSGGAGGGWTDISGFNSSSTSNPL